MAKNHLWHEVSETEKEEIRSEAKHLLTEFGKKLEKISAPEGHYTKDQGYREEGTGWETDPDFKDITFSNAPFVKGDSLVAEKGSWKK